MSVKICVCSDNHGDINSINKILLDNQTCDYYFHLGDSNLDSEIIKPFISVQGNNDWNGNFPFKRTVQIGNHNILLIHGTGFTHSYEELANKAKIENCDVIMFGHTHVFLDIVYNGIRIINPGSCYHNRDLSNPCYAIVNIEEDGKIVVERVDL